MAYSSEEFITDPTNHVLAIIDDSTFAAAAELALQGAGLPEVQLYRGFAGAEAIDSSGTEHGVGAQVVRTVQAALTNKDNLHEYQQALKTGRSVIALRVEDEAGKDLAVGILEGNSAHTINYFGTLMVTTIKP